MEGGDVLSNAYRQPPHDNGFSIAAGLGGSHAGRFPLGTFVINVTGCFMIGVLMPLLTERVGINPLWRLLLVTGFLGGYTTFSSFSLQTMLLVQDGQWFSAAGNIAAGLIYLTVIQFIEVKDAWRYIFWVSVLPALLLVFLNIRYLHEPEAWKKSVLDRKTSGKKGGMTELFSDIEIIQPCFEPDSVGPCLVEFFKHGDQLPSSFT